MVPNSKKANATQWFQTAKKKKNGKNGKLIHFESISKSEALCKYFQSENIYGGLDLMN